MNTKYECSLCTCFPFSSVLRSIKSEEEDGILKNKSRVSPARGVTKEVGEGVDKEVEEGVDEGVEEGADKGCSDGSGEGSIKDSKKNSEESTFDCDKSDSHTPKSGGNKVKRDSDGDGDSCRDKVEGGDPGDSIVDNGDERKLSVFCSSNKDDAANSNNNDSVPVQFNVNILTGSSSR